MNKEMRELKSRIETSRNEANELYLAKDYVEAEKKLNEIEELEKQYAIAAKLFKTEKERVPEDAMINNDKIKNFANGVRKALNTANETIGTEGGYTVSEDVRKDIEHLRQSEESLEDLVSVETVDKESGSRTFKKRSNQKGFNEVGEGKKIGIKPTPKYDKMEYKIKKYAGIYPATNELLEDSDADIYNELTEWIGSESRATRNRLILETINKNPKVKVNGLDGIKNVLNVKLGAAFKNSSKVITNDTGLNYLDTLKDSEGNYILSSNPSDPMKMFISAGAATVPLKTYSNNTIPNEYEFVSTSDKEVVEGKIYATRTGEEGSYEYNIIDEPTGDPSALSYFEATAIYVPITIGDLKEGIRLFDRKKLNIKTSDSASAGDINAFDDDLTLFRAIEREDVQLRDNEAFVNGYIEINLVPTI